MVKNWQKQLNKYSKVFWLEKIVEDILLNNLSSYDVIRLSWYSDLFRLRKWKIRVIFRANSSIIEIIKIDNRWDVYKGL